MTVEMQDVIVIRLSLEMLFKLLKRRWSQQRHRRGNLFAGNQVDKRTGDRSKLHVGLIRPSRHQQNVDDISG